MVKSRTKFISILVAALMLLTVAFVSITAANASTDEPAGEAAVSSAMY